MTSVRTLVLITAALVATITHGGDGVNLGGGNLETRDEAEKFQVLQEIGATVCRVPMGGSEYWNKEMPTPERADAIVLKAHAHGIVPVFLFEYYTRWNGECCAR